MLTTNRCLHIQSWHKPAANYLAALSAFFAFLAAFLAAFFSALAAALSAFMSALAAGAAAAGAAAAGAAGLAAAGAAAWANTPEAKVAAMRAAMILDMVFSLNDLG
jgi:hypothetical protein